MSKGDAIAILIGGIGFVVGCIFHAQILGLVGYH